LRKKNRTKIKIINKGNAFAFKNINAIYPLIFPLIILTFSISSIIGTYGVIIESEAESKIIEAEKIVSSVYITILNAEKSQVDVTNYLNQLTYSGFQLSEAQMHYRNGNFEKAIYYADLSIENVKGLPEKVEQSKNHAIVKNNERALRMFAISSMVIIAIICGSIYGWRLFKHRYFFGRGDNIRLLKHTCEENISTY
jgi:hypothetical protein